MTTKHPPKTPPAQVPSPRTYAHALARWCVRPLLRSPLTPNHLTTLRLVTGCAAALGFAVGDPVWGLWGGLAFIVSTLLDRADGELARLSGRVSAAGHRYDLWCDLASNALAFIGIGIGAAHGSLGVLAIILGVVAGVLIAAIFLVVFGLHDHGSTPQAAFGAPSRFDLDDGLFLLAPVVWLEWREPLLVTAACGAPLFLVYALIRYRRIRMPRDARR